MLTTHERGVGNHSGLLDLIDIKPHFRGTGVLTDKLIEETLKFFDGLDIKYAVAYGRLAQYYDYCRQHRGKCSKETLDSLDDYFGKKIHEKPARKHLPKISADLNEYFSKLLEPGSAVSDYGIGFHKRNGGHPICPIPYASRVMRSVPRGDMGAELELDKQRRIYQEGGEYNFNPEWFEHGFLAIYDLGELRMRGRI